jgi:predicted kinase
MYNREYTSERIIRLEPNEIFVFGSNLAGAHGGGAARIALDFFGAVWGQGVGLQGQSYAIPTMQGGVETIKPYVDEFIEFAKVHPELKFLVTRIGCGIAGFRDEEIAPLFTDAIEADMLGRKCDDQQEVLDKIVLCEELAKEEGCYEGCYPFPSTQIQRAFLSGRDVWKNQELYDDCWGEVVLMSGLPGTGKDTWIKQNVSDLPMISLDDIRRSNKISPTAAQGKVANIAREQAKEYLRQHQPFVWNATNITPQMRESLVSLFETYHAHVRIVYLETKWLTLLERNRSREDAVPQSVIEEMMGKMTLPEASEARKVEWVVV